MGRDNPTACYRELGQALRTTRKAAGLTGSEIAHRAGWERTKVHRIEMGQYPLKDHELLSYLGFCGIYLPRAGDFMALWRRAHYGFGYWLEPPGTRPSGSLRSFMYHENEAEAATIYQPQLVPGLLQTADYAHNRIAVGHATPEYIEQRVRSRLERQRILRVPHPAPFTFYVNEAALRLEVGSAALMHEQLLKIVLMAALDHITVRVVPSSAGERAVVGGPFSLFGHTRHAPLVYIDLIESGLFLEDKSYVEPYRKLVPDIADVALDPDESREFIAALASEYDQRSKRDAHQC